MKACIIANCCCCDGRIFDYLCFIFRVLVRCYRDFNLFAIFSFDYLIQILKYDSSSGFNLFAVYGERCRVQLQLDFSMVISGRRIETLAFYSYFVSVSVCYDAAVNESPILELF